MRNECSLAKFIPQCWGLAERIDRDADGEARERADEARSFLDVGEMSEEIWERFVKGPVCIRMGGLRSGGILGMKWG